MERKEKIDAFIDFLDENHITIIETSTIQGLIIDAQFTIDQDESEDEYNELIEKGLTDEDFESLNEFLESKMLMMIKTDDVNGVSFENCEISSNTFPEFATDLWKDEEENNEEEE